MANQSSPQARWARKQQRLGKCRICGKPRTARSKWLCDEHTDKFKVYMKQWRDRRKAQLKGEQPNEGTDQGTGN